jgi:hypothetical protein
MDDDTGLLRAHGLSDANFVPIQAMTKIDALNPAQASNAAKA